MVFFVVFSAINVYGQEKAPEKVTKTNTNGWYMYFGNFRLSDKFGIHALFHVRRSNVITDWQQSLNRIGLNYHIRDNDAIFTVGYDYVVTFPYGELPISENNRSHGAWEALTLKHKVGSVSLMHRYRLEQLWGKSISADSYKYKNNFRYMILAGVPIVGNWFFSFFDEVFISFGKNVKYNNFNQNRLYGAIGYKIKNGDIQLGYMDQIIKKGVGLTYENNNTLMVGLNYNMDFRKKDN